MRKRINSTVYEKLSALDMTLSLKWSSIANAQYIISSIYYTDYVAVQIYILMSAIWKAFPFIKE